MEKSQNVGTKSLKVHLRQICIAGPKDLGVPAHFE